MKLWIIDELTLKNKIDLNPAGIQVSISCIELPDTMLLDIFEKLKKINEADNGTGRA